MAEWPLYRPVIAFFEDQGYQAASQVTDPGGTRFELDVVAFTPELDDVRVVEVKREASEKLVEQCRDRWRYARRVYAAAPAGEAARLLDVDERLGVLAVSRDSVDVLRQPAAVGEHVETAKANALRRVLRAELARG